MLKNLNIKLPDDPAIPLLWVYAQKNSRDSWKRYLFTITEVFFTTAKRWKLSKCPLADEWISKMYYKCTMDYYSALKRNEILTHATTWMNLEDIMLSKRSQLQKDKCCAILLMWSIWHSQSYKQEVQQVGERVAMGKRNQCSVGITFQFCKMKTFKRCVAWLSESSYY